jgi:cell division protein FtsN
MNSPNYVRPNNSKPKHGSPANNSGGTLIGIFVGLVLGILIALGVVLYLNRADLPFQDKYEGATKPAAPPVNGEGATPLPLPGKPGNATPEKQRLDFYGMLEGKSAPGQTSPSTVAPQTSQPTPVPAGTKTDGAASTETLFLQLGSFQQPADAENLKAKLTLTGFDAVVQVVDIPDKGTMHRVRVGPFANITEMESARGRLAQAGVPATVVKLKQ